MKLRHGALILSALICSGLVLAAYAQKQTSTGHPSFPRSSKATRAKDEARLIRARANWFFHQRAFPSQHIPAFARERAWNDFRQMQQRQRLLQKYGGNYRKQMAALSAAISAPNPATPWTPIGPQPTRAYFNQPDVSGRVSALLVDPCDSTGNTVFLGGAQGGLWKTTDGGLHWTPLDDLAPSLAVGSIAVPPASGGCVGTPLSSKTIYVGTGEENFSFDSYYGAGVLVCTTTDGATYSCARPTNQTFGNYVFTSQPQPIAQSYGGPYIGGLAVDPQNPSILLAAVQGSGSTLPSGAYCSADGGVTWTDVVPGLGTLYEVSTGVAFDQAGVAYVAIGNIDGSGSINGIYQSFANGTPAALGTCATSTSNANLKFTALSGLTNAAGGSSQMGRISFSVYSSSTTSSSGDEIFAAVANASDRSNTLNGIYKNTTGGGGAWTLATSTDYCANQCFYDLPITIDPHNASVIYAGGSAPGTTGHTIFASTDGGSSWTDVADNSNSLTGVHVDAHAIAFAPPGTGTSSPASKVYVGTDGGVWSTSNPESPSTSQSWTDLNATLGLTQIYSGMSSNPSGWTYRTFLGAQDNGMQVYGQEAGAIWDDTLACGDGGVTLIDPLIPSTVYGVCAYIPGTATTPPFLGIEKSLFNGSVDEASGYSTFFEAMNGINGSDNGNFTPPFAIDPNQTGATGDAQTLYFGTYRVWQTTDGANTWAPISPNLTGLSQTSSTCQQYSLDCVLTTIAVAPSNSNEVVTGSSFGNVAVTLNAGQGVNSTWTDVTGTGMLPPRYITQVAVCPNSTACPGTPSNIFFATFSGFSGFGGDTKGHVFLGTLTTTGTPPATVWTDISSNATLCPTGTGSLPNIPVNSIVVDPSLSGTLYVGTDVGIYMGTLQGTAPAYTGACWQPLGTGLPNSAVLSLSLNEASRTLIAGTHGRSAWTFPLGGLPAFALTSLNPASAPAGGSSFTLTLDGNGFSSPTVNWTVNGTTPPNCTVTPTPLSATQFTASVSASCLASGGMAEVSVMESSPPATSTDCNGKANSTNCLAFTITSSPPTVTSISPSSGGTGNSVSMALQGTNFFSSTTIGLSTVVSALPCSPLTQNSGGSSTQITTTIPASCFQYPGGYFGGIYFVTANNPKPGGGSSNPDLTAAAAPYGIACTGMNPPGCLLTLKGSAPSNDSFAGATNIALSGGSYNVTEDTSGASASSSDPAISTTCTNVGALNKYGDYNSVWFKFTPSSNTTAEVDTIGSSYDTILSVWTGTSSNLTSVACDDDIVSTTDLPSQISNLSLTAGTTYYFMVSDWGVPVQNGSGTTTQILSSGGKLVFHMAASSVPTPTFTASASNLNPTSITAGSAATFTLTLSGSPTSTSGTVTLQPCTSSPSTSTITCTYNPSTLSVGPSSTSTSTVTINTVSRGAIPPSGPFQSPPLGWMLAILGAAALLAFAARRRAAARSPLAVRSRLAAALGFALLAGVLLFSGACGGGGGSSSGGTTPSGTQAGSYTITVPTSPSPSGSNASVTLTVQ